MLDDVMYLAGLQTEYLPNMDEYYPKWMKQSCLIHLLESIFSTDTQKQDAADELGRLDYDRAKFSAYWSPSYSQSDYAQNQDPTSSEGGGNDSFPYTLPFILA